MGGAFNLGSINVLFQSKIFVDSWRKIQNRNFENGTQITLIFMLEDDFNPSDFYTKKVSKPPPLKKMGEAFNLGSINVLFKSKIFVDSWRKLFWKR